MFKNDALIILVDDMAAARDLTQGYLEGFGFNNIFTAEDGREAYDTIMSFAELSTPVELVISDWMMPVMSGLELLQKVRGNPKTAKIPFLMTTSEGNAPQVIKAIMQGVSDYAVKPFDSQTLFKKLTQVWNKTHPKG